MQAHPLSHPAARILSTSPTAQPPRASKAGGSSPHRPASPAPRPASGFRAELIAGLMYEAMTSGLVYPETTDGLAYSETSYSLAYPETTCGLATELRSAFGAPRPDAPEAPTAESTDLLKAASLAEGAGLAHDAGNLLGALGLYCDLLQAPGVLQPEHRHYAVELRQLAERSGAMIQRLLVSSHPARPAETHPDSCDPAAVLGAQAAILNNVAGPKATVTVDVQRGLTFAPVSGEALERIALNLVRNAAEAIGKAHTGMSQEEMRQGSIRVMFRQVGPRVELCVEDDGPGLTPAMAAEFLHPTALPAGAARGLGHRIVHELAQKSGGEISIRVQPGRGSAIRLSWPLTNAIATGLDRGGSAAC